MKSPEPIETTLVNGLLGDPAVYGFFPRTGDALLFDLGVIDRIANRDLLKVRLALVSHTHIDHFIGFDRLLRVNIPHRRLLEVVGPPGMIRNVKGKLEGYLWNLVDAAQIRMIVHEVGVDGAVMSAELENQTGFTPELIIRAPVEVSRLDRPLLAAPVASFSVFGDGTRIDAIALDHGCPSIAYAVQLPARLKVRDGALAALGQEPGPWIRDLQIALGERELSEPFQLGGQTYTAEDLGARLFETQQQRPVGYMTDLGFTETNLARTRQLFAGTSKLISECNYRDTEHQRARDRMHLTTRQAALLAAHAGVEMLEIFHVSNIYADSAETSRAEAAAYFATYRAMSASELTSAITAELERRA